MAIFEHYGGMYFPSLGIRQVSFPGVLFFLMTGTEVTKLALWCFGNEMKVLKH